MGRALVSGFCWTLGAIGALIVAGALFVGVVAAVLALTGG